MSSLDGAISDLQVLVRTESSTWRDLVRQQLQIVRRGLSVAVPRPPEAWLAARESCRNRERSRLLARVSALVSVVALRSDESALRTELSRLTTDLAHFVQRTHDLAYDAVALDLGGSE